MKTICRVPLQVLSLRLSILYLRTCVGLGYGSNNNIIFLVRHLLVIRVLNIRKAKIKQNGITKNRCLRYAIPSTTALPPKGGDGGGGDYERQKDFLL
jgi:hypothetical protein